MLYRGVHITAASGSLGGTVYSHNRGGYYTRNRTVPVDPNTPEQQAMRTALASLAVYWADTLSSGQREAWQAFADGVKRPNRIGDHRSVGGRAEFFRANLPRAQANTWLAEDLDFVVAPPSSGAAVADPLYGAQIMDPSNPTLMLTWAGTAPWDGTAEASLLVYFSDQRPQTVNRYFGAWTLGFAAHNQSGPGQLEFTPDHVPPIDNALRIWVRVRSTMPDGSLGTPQTILLPPFA